MRTKEEQLASDPNTPAEVLRALFAPQDPERLTAAEEALGLALVQNPNTPKQLLLWLGQRYPQELLQNPSLSLFLLEEPGLFHQIPHNTLAAILEQIAPLPSFIIEGALSTEDHHASYVFARTPQTPPQILTHFASHQDYGVRRTVAQNPSTPPALLESMIQDGKMTVRFGVAQNPSTPLWLLEHLAKSRHHAMRSAVAQNRGLPRWLQEELARDPHEAVRQEIAQNPSTPEEILQILLRDEHPAVPGRIAENPKAPLAILEGLAQHPELQVREELVSSRHMSTLFFALLEQQESGAHSHILALFALDAPDQNRLARAMLESENAPENFAARFGVSRYPLARMVVAAGGKGKFFTESETGKIKRYALIKDPDEGVRCALASNPRMRPPVLVQLAQDQSPEVRRRVMHNPSTLPETRAALRLEFPEPRSQPQGASHGVFDAEAPFSFEE